MIERKITSDELAKLTAKAAKTKHVKKRIEWIVVAVGLFAYAIFAPNSIFKKALNDPSPQRILALIVGIAVAVTVILFLNKKSKKSSFKSATPTSVTDYSLDIVNIFTAIDQNGDGMTWWLFKLKDDRWFVFADQDAFDLMSQEKVEHELQHQRLQITIADNGAVLSLKGGGSGMQAERNDDVESDKIVYWSPPEKTNLKILNRREDLNLPESVN